MHLVSKETVIRSVTNTMTTIATTTTTSNYCYYYYYYPRQEVLRSVVFVCLLVGWLARSLASSFVRSHPATG